MKIVSCTGKTLQQRIAGLLNSYSKMIDQGITTPADAERDIKKSIVLILEKSILVS